MSIKILATGDVHIGRKSSGIPVETAESATRYTWHRMIKYAIDNQMDAVVLTGDVIDRDNRYFEAIGPLQQGFEKLKSAEIEVFVIAGNHDFDVLPQMLSSQQFPNVHLLGAGGKWEFRKLSRRNQTVTFAGWSFPDQHVPYNPLTKTPLILPPGQSPVIALLHTDLNTPGSRYAPVSVADLLNTDADLWLLGHIHKPFGTESSRRAVYYTGSPHAMSSGEPGAHGPIEVTIEPNKQITVRRVPLSPIRYEAVKVDVTGIKANEDMRGALHNALQEHARDISGELDQVAYLVYDVTLTGRYNRINELEADMSLMAGQYNTTHDNGLTRLLVRKVKMELTPEVENLQELARQSSPAGLLAETIIALEANRMTPFAKKLLTQWKLKRDNLNASETYLALKSMPASENHLTTGGSTYILHECRRLLGTLLMQQAQ